MALKILSLIEDNLNHITYIGSGMGAVITGLDKIALRQLAPDYGFEYKDYKEIVLYYEYKMVKSAKDARDNSEDSE